MAAPATWESISPRIEYGGSGEKDWGYQDIPVPSRNVKEGIKMCVGTDNPVEPPATLHVPTGNQCASCRLKLRHGARFCPHCGEKVMRVSKMKEKWSLIGSLKQKIAKLEKTIENLERNAKDDDKAIISLQRKLEDLEFEEVPRTHTRKRMDETIVTWYDADKKKHVRGIVTGVSFLVNSDEPIQSIENWVLCRRKQK